MPGADFQKSCSEKFCKIYRSVGVSFDSRTVFFSCEFCKIFQNRLFFRSHPRDCLYKFPKEKIAHLAPNFLSSHYLKTFVGFYLHGDTWLSLVKTDWFQKLVRSYYFCISVSKGFTFLLEGCQFKPYWKLDMALTL